MWVSCIVEAIGVNLNIPEFITCRGYDHVHMYTLSVIIPINCSDLTLDTQLQLIKSRESFEYNYTTDSELKDGRYKGPWLNGKPHGL